MRTVVEIAARGLFGGLLVVAFAMVAEVLVPKRFAGVFAAAPSVALAGLTVSVLAKGLPAAQAAAYGMIAGAVGFVAYCALAPALLRRWGAYRGSAAALVLWFLVVALLFPWVPR